MALAEDIKPDAHDIARPPATLVRRPNDLVLVLPDIVRAVHLIAPVAGRWAQTAGASDQVHGPDASSNPDGSYGNLKYVSTIGGGRCGEESRFKARESLCPSIR